MRTMASNDDNPLPGLQKGAGEDLSILGTEAVNPDTRQLDSSDALTIVGLMNDADAQVAHAVREALPQIAEAAEAAATSLAGSGRLIYVGAGTSGRLGVLDAAECPPTFDTSPDQVVGVIAGGRTALLSAVEGAEDDPDAGAADLAALDVTAADTVVGLAASGRTPYVIGALDAATAVGATTVSVACNPSAAISSHALIAVEVATGPEVLTGSTRLKAGTAQKMVCNMISTAAMIRLGKTYGNLMVDMRPSNAKLRDRAERIVSQATGTSRDAAAAALDAADGRTKVAVVMLLAQVDADPAQIALEGVGGRIRPAVADLEARA